MPEGERAPTDRHATWVALRTVRQRPTVVGRTDDGETVYEVRSVRLLLPAGSSHFRRLVPCATCGREISGSSVLGPDDLDRQPNTVLCGGCARAGPKVVASSPSPEPPAAEPPVLEPAPLAAIEARLAEVTRRLNSAPAVDEQVVVLGKAVAELQRELRHVARTPANAASEVAATLDAQRAELNASFAKAERGLRAEISALAKQTRDQAAAITGLVEAQRRLTSKPAENPEMAALPAALTELRGQLEKVADAQTDAGKDLAAMLDAQRERVDASLAEAQGDLRAELSAVAQQARDQAEVVSGLIAAQRGEMQHGLEIVVQRTLAAVAESIEDLKERQQAIEDRLSAMAEVGTADVLARAIEGRLAKVEATIAALEAERRSADDGLERMWADLAALAEAVRQAPSQSAQEALDAVSDPLRDLTRARQATEDQLFALRASIDEGASRDHRLEQRVNECMQQVNRLLEALAEGEPPASHVAPGGILVALERQLRAAEQRLAQR